MKKFAELNEDISSLLKISTVPMQDSNFMETQSFTQDFKGRQETKSQNDFDLAKEKTRLDLRMRISFLEREINPLSLFSNENKKPDQGLVKLLEVLKNELSMLN
ncbi:MAG: hypothetical protein FWE36_04760 [Erysipelotrichales bacterium]|nr:hypothetical protein [Erysipelotrichales bacterium]